MTYKIFWRIRSSKMGRRSRSYRILVRHFIVLKDYWSLLSRKIRLLPILWRIFYKMSDKSNMILYQGSSLPKIWSRNGQFKNRKWGTFFVASPSIYNSTLRWGRGEKYLSQHCYTGTLNCKDETCFSLYLEDQSKHSILQNIWENCCFYTRCLF